MPDQPTEKTDVAAPATEGQETLTAELNSKEETKTEEPASTEDKTEDKTEDNTEDKIEDKKDEATEDKAAAEGDSEMPDAPDASAVDADQSTTADKTPASSKAQQNRRKSGGAARKTPNKKASKAKTTNLDAKPGDYFLVKLKGFPEWPAVVCDESMLPQALLTTRPVTAAKPDGTYAEQYADGGKRVSDRNFPVMYLHTNEFGWVINTALTALTEEGAKKALDGKLRKDLREAFELAAEHHPLDHYKDLLKKFEEEVIAREKALQEAAATPKKSKKARGKAGDDDEDTDMADAEVPKSKSKKRKADDEAATPQRTDSAKKPKIKLNTSSTPKNTNGTASQAKDASGKAKPKAKKVEKNEKLTAEERLARKEKEVLYLRYKLQRGLLNKDQSPKEDEMKQMADYMTMLESVGDQLEVAIIRATRINKVLKQILKLSSIPREEEFNFRSRSQKLLDSWNRVMSEPPAKDADAKDSAAANGVTNGSAEDAEDKRATPDEADGKAETKEETEAEETKEDSKSDDKASEPEGKAEELTKEASGAEAVEAAA